MAMQIEKATNDKNSLLRELIEEDKKNIRKRGFAKLSIMQYIPNNLFYLEDNAIVELEKDFKDIEPLIDKALNREGEVYKRIYKEKVDNKFRKISAPCYVALEKEEWRKINHFLMEFYRRLVHLNKLGIKSKVFLVMDDSEFPEKFKEIRNSIDFALKTDISSYSESTPHVTLLAIIDKLEIPDKVKKFLKWYVENQYICFDEELVKAEIGIVQGGHITDFLLLSTTRLIAFCLARCLENLYIFIKKDDFLILSKDKQALREAKRLLKEILIDLGLRINEDKTEFIRFGDKKIEFLSYTIDKDKKITVRASSWERLKREIKRTPKKMSVPCMIHKCDSRRHKHEAIPKTEKLLRKIMGRLSRYVDLVDYYDRNILDDFYDYLTEVALKDYKIGVLARFGWINFCIDKEHYMCYPIANKEEILKRLDNGFTEEFIKKFEKELKKHEWKNVIINLTKKTCLLRAIKNNREYIIKLKISLTEDTISLAKEVMNLLMYETDHHTILLTPIAIFITAGKNIVDKFKETDEYKKLVELGIDPSELESFYICEIRKNLRGLSKSIILSLFSKVSDYP